MAMFSKFKSEADAMNERLFLKVAWENNRPNLRSLPPPPPGGVGIIGFFVLPIRTQPRSHKSKRICVNRKLAIDGRIFVASLKYTLPRSIPDLPAAADEKEGEKK